MRARQLTYGLCIAASLVLGCGDNSGLDFDPGPSDGGGMAGVGGSVGPGGAGGSVGGAGGNVGSGGGGGARDAGAAPDAKACGPVCLIACPYGNVLDENGCPTCKCKPKPEVCPAIGCRLACQYGYKKDANGCDVCECNPPPVCKPVACDIFCQYGHKKDASGCALCECNPPPTCQPVTCKILCQYGFKKDANGCEVCECNPAPACKPDECPPPPPVVPQMCADGTYSSMSCQRDGAGRCGWVFRDCPVDCGQIGDAATCGRQTHCTWLQPGCTEPKLSAAGCYARAALDCGVRGCPGGKICTKRTVNPCTSTSLSFAPAPGTGGGAIAPAPPMCAACAQTVAICL